MSWTKAALFSGEDVFDEYADDLSLQSKEWTCNMKKRVRDGFVDGVDAGEQASLQAGFDLGFREGAAQTAAVGRLKGIASAIWCWCQIQYPEKPVPASVTELLQQVAQHEDKVMVDISNPLETPAPSVSSISESMEDLDMEQTDSNFCREGCKEIDCCKTEEQMDLGVPHQPQKLWSGSTYCSPSSGESLKQLQQRCMDVVTELGLPQELVGHIQELNNI
ncbi:OTU deubiquitinase with linear linkage specificity a [Mastacembelus armatus]|uniref:OTU deubiquitinase with linear linkage specificity a n=1 Tax=Mastacembelus armatus TaxID=205130 RepID=A0A7N8XEB2_9TELE|nr:protein YAE1 homolog [Mastacembelus armatus]